MFNVTTLLRTTSPDLARVATWDVKPQIQEVHGNMEWEGNYIGRQSFEIVLARIQNTEMAKLHPDLVLLNHQRIDTRFSSVDYSKAVIVATKWLTPPCVLLSREEGKESYAHSSFSFRNSLKEWCLRYGLKSVADRIDLTISSYPIPSDWKSSPIIPLPPLADEDATSLLSTHSSTSFRFTNGRSRDHDPSSNFLRIASPARKFSCPPAGSSAVERTTAFVFNSAQDTTVRRGDP